MNDVARDVGRAAGTGMGAGIILLAAYVSIILEGRRKNVASLNELPYTWGFFQGMNGLLMGLYSLYWAVVALTTPEGSPISAGLFLMLAAIWCTAGYFVIKRRKWAWVVSTIASCNPVWWIANLIYGRNRWNEFDAVGSQNFSR
jgi:hypothetical protein